MRILFDLMEERLYNKRRVGQRRGWAMDYKTLKKLLETLQICEEKNVIIEKEVMLSVVEEVLIMRRRNAAKIRQDLANKNKAKAK